MDNATILNGVTPQQLTENIVNEVRKEFQDLKTHFQPKEPEEFLTRNETAKLLKISLVTVHEWTNKGIIKPLKIGNRTYYSRKEITETLLNSNS